jgi:hypothetical protein
VNTVEPTPATPSDIAAVLALVAALKAHAAAREERNRLREEENSWLKARLFGRSSQKTPHDQINPDQVWLFNEAEALANAAEAAPQSVTIPTHERGKRGRKKLPVELPRIEVVHDIAVSEKICAADGTPLERIGAEISEASANLYSLVETSKANGVEPHAYLSHLFDKLPYARNVEDLEALLPWEHQGSSTCSRHRLAPGDLTQVQPHRSISLG